MKRKPLFYFMFFSVLTAVFVLALSVVMPGFLRKKVKPIGKVEPFAFVTQDGAQFTQKDMAGKVALVNFFFTTCTSICPRMNNNLKPAYETFKTNPNLLLLSFTSDPARDSAQRLKWYADSLGVNTSKWVFLTGKKDSLYKAARYSFHVDDPKNFADNDGVDFLHTQFVALVNKKGEVVKIYDGLKPSELQAIPDDVNRLLEN